MTEERVAALVGLPVELTIPNSYSLASIPAEKGSHVDPSTPLGKRYTKLARILLNDRLDIPSRRRKFLEFLYRPFGKPQATTA